MFTVTKHTKDMRPIILNYAVQLIAGEKPLYKYDFIESMNFINYLEQKIAFIDSNSSNISLLTETKAGREGSDSDLSHLEFNTVTRASREQDDCSELLLEMKIQTYTARERDEESFDYN